MSIRTSAGRSRRAWSTASPAVLGLADHLDVRRRLEQLAEPGADERLVVGDEHARAHASGSRAADLESAAVARGPARSSPP